MRRQPTTIGLLVGVMLLPSVAHAQGRSERDMLHGAVAPYLQALERSRFLRIAGRDSVLSQEEFEADSQGRRYFFREFDQWKVLLRFDADASGDLDWMEANEYRRALGEGIVKQFDRDQNGRLSGSERDAAIADLKAGWLPDITRRRPASSRPNAATLEGDPNEDPQSLEAMQRESERNRQVLTNLSDSQRQHVESIAAWRYPGHDPAEIQATKVRLFDANGDGRLDAEEKRVIDQAIQAIAVEKWDHNGDGLLDADEQAIQSVEQQLTWNLELTEQVIYEGFLFQVEQEIGELDAEGRDLARRYAWKQFDQMQAGEELLYELYDTDRSGRFEVEEARRYQQDIQRRTEMQKQMMLKHLDRNNNGVLDPEEMQRFQHAMNTTFDLNGDGKTSFLEGQRAMEENFDRMDTNGDGILFGEEQLGYMRIVLERMK